MDLERASPNSSPKNGKKNKNNNHTITTNATVPRKINGGTSPNTLNQKNKKYIPEDAKERLENYVYRAQDKSLLYKYFWSPVVRKVVQYLPVWLAPNVITVMALFFVCVTYVLLSLSMPYLAVPNTYVKQVAPQDRHDINYNAPYGDYLPPPRYVLLLAALALFLYQLLDNLDGHQARRTGTSGPLGLLMDHGCDAFNCVVGALNLATTLAAGPGWKSFLVLLNTVVVFLLNTLEEYYRGELVLPLINGPNEGILIAISFYLWTAFKGGPQWWSENAVEIPAEWLPAVLRQSPPQAAADVERLFLTYTCPLLTLPGRRHQQDEFSALPFFFNLNCTPSYVASPTLPTLREHAYEKEEHPVMAKLWKANSPVQNTVLRLYGSSETGMRVRYNTIAVWVMTAMAVTTCFNHITEVYKALRRMPEKEKSKFGDGWFSRRFPFLHALSRVMPIVCCTLLSVVWFATSQENIFRRHPRLFCWTVGLLYTKISIHIMVAHLLEEPFRPFRRTFLPFLIFAAHICLTYVHNVNRARKEFLNSRRTGGSRNTIPNLNENPASQAPHNDTAFVLSTYADYAYDLDEEIILYEFFLLSLVTFVHLVYHVTREVASTLNVPIFTVPKEKQRVLREKIAKEKAEKKLAKTNKAKQK